MPRALLSVSNKAGIVDLGRELVARGFEIVSTGGTARALSDAGLPVTHVSVLTGVPEMMDGRVKTLHPALHAGILARRDRPDDLTAAEMQRIGLVDVVVVNLYPFVEAASDPATPFDALVEEIDIGGPSLVRAAAKNFRDVIVIVDPADYPRLLSALEEGPSLELRFELMRKAYNHTAAYDAAVARTLGEIALVDGRFERAPSHSEAGLPGRIDVSLAKIRDLRYGENPHQRAAWYRPWDRPPDAGVVPVSGKELSYTNLLDLDAAARLVLEFGEPAAVVVKHTNPCGAALGSSAADAYVHARDVDRLSAFGGIVGLNRPIDVAAAEAIVSTFIEAVLAPGVEDDARAVLARKPNMRVAIADFALLRRGGLEFRPALGGILAQERDVVSEARGPWAERAVDATRVMTKRPPSAQEWEALRFAWRVAAHVKSNAVIFTDVRRTLAIGAGQMSRVDAVKVAIMKAQANGADPSRSLVGSVAASDAYFPFRDGLDAVAAAGASAVVQPGGSVRDAEVIAAADAHGLAMVFTGRRHFRH